MKHPRTAIRGTVTLALVAAMTFAGTSAIAFADTDVSPPDPTTTGTPETTPSSSPGDDATGDSAPAPDAAPEAHTTAWDGVTPQEPVFQDGQAQPVYADHPLVQQEVWITVPGVDSDRDGADDRLRATVYRPKDTDLGAASITVPSVVQMSPYYGGFASEYFLHDMHQPGWDPSQPVPVGTAGTIPDTSGSPYDNRPNSRFYTDRGFAYVAVAALGTNLSTGCPSMLNDDEAASTRAVVDWLAGRTQAQDLSGNPVSATWSSGKVGMTGVSYDGTLPILASTTGVKGLETVVPVSALSSFYDYYRVGGLIVEPEGYPGEDLDNYVSALLSTPSLQEKCASLAEEFAQQQDRATGQYSDFWAERDFFENVGNVTTPTLIAAGLADWNVRLDQTTKWYQALKAQGVPVKLVLHQYGHATPPSSGDFNWRVLLNKWFSHYLFGVDNGVENTSEVSLQNQDKTTWTYADSWPLPGSEAATLNTRPATDGRSGLVVFDEPASSAALAAAGDTTLSLTDDAVTSQQVLATSDDPGRVILATNPAAEDIRISGFTQADLRLSFSSLAPNLSLQLIDRAADGSVHVVSRGWWDPQNRNSLTSSEAVTPGEFYDMSIPLISTEYVLPAGHTLELMVFSTDIDGADPDNPLCTTLCLTPGTVITIDTAASTLSVPFVGGGARAAEVFGSEPAPAEPTTEPTATPGEPTASSTIGPNPTQTDATGPLANTGGEGVPFAWPIAALLAALGVGLAWRARHSGTRRSS
ncbi:prolyl oligopeptidase family serine peptidase [Pseudoclavibacter chungangensis]|uniref:Xaa-Pro dipeptidyl-peptidase n=1 Tax=Pseudoclavibacter chungangensis TaxID=587635 RepID=A0A7J5BNR5_9MICO|nr:CocE/NonD family hydrolase [Pseudoclavibacter chungangensis]KAB1654064.1 prolyl oligopeptidase family serine peptidase [Pseudoclavibacter chungangensis]NYJ66026.1 X-Pro dipeptidyl-peptidase [Pseudoclavibacter chungangensis]